MTDPKRLLEDLTLGDDARSALRAGKALRGDTSRRDAIWAAMVPALPPAPDGGLGSGLESAGQAGTGASLAAGAKASGVNALGQGVAVGAKTAGWLGFFKAGVIGAGLMGAALGTQTLLAPPSVVEPAPLARVSAIVLPPEPPSRAPEAVAVAPLPPPVASAPSSATTAVARPVLPSLPPEDETPAPSSPEISAVSPPAAISAAPVSPAEERLALAKEEARLVGEAEQAIRRGDTREAQRILGVLREKHPRGVLGQEREVLAIEVLARTGQQAQASAQAEAFLQRNPKSPFAERLRPLVLGR